MNNCVIIRSHGAVATDKSIVWSYEIDTERMGVVAQTTRVVEPSRYHTENKAHYLGLLDALYYVRRVFGYGVEVQVESTNRYVARQMIGQWKIGKSACRYVATDCLELLSKFRFVSTVHASTKAREQIRLRNRVEDKAQERGLVLETKSYVVQTAIRRHINRQLDEKLTFERNSEK